jgi:hypothetical protein
VVKVSKFVGKFRKEKFYSDDYGNSKNALKEKKNRDSQSDVRKQKMNWEQENFYDDEYENFSIKTDNY